MEIILLILCVWSPADGSTQHCCSSSID